MNVKLFTCMPSGDYCDIITGRRENGQCTGTVVRVDDNGEAQIVVSASVGVLAIHIGVRQFRQLDVVNQIANGFLILGRSYRYTASDTCRMDVIRTNNFSVQFEYGWLNKCESVLPMCARA